MYRPEGWKAIEQPFWCVNPPYGDYISAYDASSLYEAGADAMLEGLKKQAVKKLKPSFDNTFHIPSAYEGYLVFIPEEKDAI